MLKEKNYLTMRSALLAAVIFAFAPLAAPAQGQRDIPSPQAENSGRQGDFPPAPSVYGQGSETAEQNDGLSQAAQSETGNAAPQNAGQENSGGAALWPSVAAENAGPAGQAQSEAAPQGQSPALNAAQPAAAETQQAIRDLQDRLQALQSRVDRLETRQTPAQPSQMPAAAVSKAVADEEGNYTVPANISADALYNLGQSFMAEGHYAKAALVWRAFAARFGQDGRAAQAGFNLGESYYARGLYGQAAEAYLTVRSRYKDAAIAPQNLLRLAQAMGNLADTQTACATLDALAHDYPRAEPALAAEAAETSRRLQCP